MKLFVIYDHPRDYPDHWVVRLWLNDTPTGFVWFAATLEEARDLIPQECVRIARHHTDDPVIVESWF